MSGLLLAACFPPFGWDTLVWFALIPLLWSLSGATPKQAVGRGYLMGLAFMGGVGLFTTSFGEGVIWMAVLPWALFTAIEALWFIPIAVALAAVLRRSRVAILAGVPAIWAVAEWARGSGTYGFPFGGLSTPAVATPVAQWASIGGCYMVSAMVAFAGTALFLLVRGDRAGRRAGIAGLIVVLLATGIGYGMSEWARAGAADSDHQFGTVLCVQGDSNDAWSSAGGYRAFEAMRAATLKAGGGAGLIVWSESSAPGAILADPALLQRATDVPARLDAPLLTGAIGYGASGAPFNAAVLFGPDRSVAGIYRKRQLVPFGEFVPLRHVLPFLGDFGVVERDEEPGMKYEVLSAGDLRLGVPICFESASPKAARAFVREGANLLVVITNDAWFGRTGMAVQHLEAARLRAIETRRWVVRCGHTGISALISPSGEVQESLPLGQAGTLSGTVGLRNDRTPYVRFGDWFVALCALAGAWAVGYGRKK
ncbi:MAG TPA: apolipoprotein N-acyltransferase [Armatimonadota bacterium]